MPLSDHVDHARRQRTDFGESERRPTSKVSSKKGRTGIRKLSLGDKCELEVTDISAHTALDLE